MELTSLKNNKWFTDNDRSHTDRVWARCSDHWTIKVLFLNDALNIFLLTVISEIFFWEKTQIKSSLSDGDLSYTNHHLTPCNNYLSFVNA